MMDQVYRGREVFSTRFRLQSNKRHGVKICVSIQSRYFTSSLCCCFAFELKYSRQNKFWINLAKLKNVFCKEFIQYWSLEKFLSSFVCSGNFPLEWLRNTFSIWWVATNNYNFCTLSEWVYADLVELRRWGSEGKWRFSLFSELEQECFSRNYFIAGCCIIEILKKSLCRMGTLLET